MNHDGMTGPALTPEERIDAALRAIGTAAPASDLHGRILTRLAAERIAPRRANTGLAALLHRMPRFAGAAVTAVFLCVAGSAIVIGSVEHSRSLHRPPVVAPPIPGLPGNGIGAASAVHPAAPASAPVLAAPTSRGRARPPATQGRAKIKRHAHKAPGVTVPPPDGTAHN